MTARLTFNQLLLSGGIEPSSVRLLRHETNHAGQNPYLLWRENPKNFEKYQCVQKASRRSYFANPYWAAFVVPPSQQTLFVGLYSITPIGTVPADWEDPLGNRPHDWSLYDLYKTVAVEDFLLYEGRLAIDWGAGTRSWVQRASKQDKEIVELQKGYVEPVFPGFAEFVIQPSQLSGVPFSWRQILSNARGVYLLTCPQTKEQYVGSACGEQGFLGRWLEYLRTGHGGNIGLRMRDPSDYRLSVLQVAGSNDRDEDVLSMEAIWKTKLQSREMGLNRN